MNLVSEWTTMSAPCSIGRSRIGVATVLSTISGTPCACATFGERLDVADVAGGIADRLAEHRARLVVDQRRDVFGAVARREARLDAVAAQRVGEQRVGGAVELRRRDDVAAAVGEREEGVGERRLAGGDARARATPPSSCATRFSRMSVVGLAMRL